MNQPPRAAQPGDIFLLLLPTGEDFARLEQEQDSWKTRYGGQLVRPIHITVQRFSPNKNQIPKDCVNTLRVNLSGMQPFAVDADAIIQFFAPYWQSYVLRWRVKSTPAWSNFRDHVKTVLDQIHCPSHFQRQRHATCTILKLNDKVDLPSATTEISLPLFTVREILISTLKEDGNFEVLERIKLQG